MGIALAASEFFEAMQAASVLHILILVYLRLLAIRKPLSRDNHIIRLRKQLIILIWTVSFSNEILGGLCGYLVGPMAYKIADIFQLFILEVAPLILIILTNYLIVKTLQKKRCESKNSDMMISNKSFAISNYDKTTKMVTILSAFLFFTLTPYLIVRAIVLLEFKLHLGIQKVTTLNKIRYHIVELYY